MFRVRSRPLAGLSAMLRAAAPACSFTRRLARRAEFLKQMLYKTKYAMWLALASGLL